MKQDNNTFAFFDVDGTLLNINSLLHFLECFFSHYFGAQEAWNRMSKYNEIVKTAGVTCSREKLNELYYQNFAGVEESVLRQLSLQWFNTVIRGQDVFNRDVISQLQYHKNNDHIVVFVSGGFFATLDELAQYLNVSHVLCVRPVINKGILTGAIDLNSQTIGNGKALAIKKFITANYDISPDQLSPLLSNCYAYGDHISDYAMLSIVGQAFAVGNDAEMLTLAKQHNWKVLGAQ